MTSEARLIVIAGPANSGKLPLAKKLLREDPTLLLVHRDAIRDVLVNPLDEWDITLLMAAMVQQLLRRGFPVVVCAWNLEPEDRKVWTFSAKLFRAELTWLDTREPDVQAMIPPMEASDAIS